jgi:hypothetical protein
MDLRVGIATYNNWKTVGGQYPKIDRRSISWDNLKRPSHCPTLTSRTSPSGSDTPSGETDKRLQTTSQIDAFMQQVGTCGGEAASKLLPRCSFGVISPTAVRRRVLPRSLTDTAEDQDRSEGSTRPDGHNKKPNALPFDPDDQY